MPDDGDRGHALTSGPLRVQVSAAGVLRVGWGEPDWFGPARLITPEAAVPAVSATAGGVMLEAGWIAGEVLAVPEERMVVLEVLGDGEKARTVMETIGGVSLESGSGSVIRFRCRSRETIAQVNAVLVNSGLQVVSLSEEKGDIEDLYFKVALHEVS